MAFLEGKFKIIELRDCPQYVVGDEFTLCGSSILPPRGKPACLFLSQAVADVFFQDRLQERKEKDRAENDITCGGCTGIVKLHFGEQDVFHTPQMQMLARAEASRMRAKKLGMFESLLKASPLFECMDEKTLSDIIGCGQVKMYAPDELIVRKGANGKHLYVIVSGKVVVTDGEGMVIAYLGRGDVFGEMSLFSGQPVCAFVRSTEHVKVLLLTSKDLINLLTKHPFLNIAFTKVLVHRLQAVNLRRSSENFSGMVGRLEDVSPSEVFLLMHENMKSGVIEMELAAGKGVVVFNEGEIVRGEYKSMRDEKAFYEILREQNGRFQYSSNLPINEMTRKPIGGFMKMLMEGLRLIDEEKSAEEKFEVDILAAEA